MQHNPVIYLHNAIRELEPLERAADDRRDIEAAWELAEQLRELWAAFYRAQPIDARGVAIKLREAAKIVRMEDQNGWGDWLARSLYHTAGKVRRLGIAAGWAEMRILLGDAQRINGDSAELILSVFPVVVDEPGIELRSMALQDFPLAA